jgi:AcrR family transcriptional regulator
MTFPERSLRERQADHVRLAVLEAAVGLLEEKTVDDVSMSDVSAAAGVSLPPLYRYLPHRASLLAAAGEHLYGSLGVPFDIGDPDDISASFLDAARRLSSRPTLTRALVQTTAGRAARSSGRPHRVAAIRTALKPLTDGLDADTARRATAVIAHLCSAVSWVSISDDSGLDDTDAQQAVAWAIDTLVAALRDESHDRRKARSRTTSPSRSTKGESR